MKKLLVLSTLTLGTLALTSGSANAGLLVIDDFDNGLTNETITAPAPQTYTNTVTAAGILSGSRGIVFQKTAGTDPDGADKATLFIDGSPDSLQIGNTTNSNSTVQINYGPAGVLNKPLVSPGSFVFPIKSNDAVPSFLELSVNGSSFVKLPIPSIPPALPGTTVSFPSNLFGDPTTLTSLSIKVSGDAGYDVEIDQIGYEYVPEPMTILGTVFALGALPKLKKAHSKKKAQ